MTIIESIKKYIGSYPPLADDRINVDFLPEEANGYSVDAVPAKRVVKQYLDGSAQCQFIFNISSRMLFGDEIRNQINNLGFFEEVENWIETNNRSKIYPELEDGLFPQKVEVSTSGYAFAPGTNVARYQMQCKLLYFKKAN